MAVELGSAYLSIGANTDGLAKDIYKELGVVEKDAKRTGQTSGSYLGKGLKKGMKVGAIALGGLVAGVGALALTGGISRALNIEDARAKLTGLGHDTKSVETIMGNALASVKGTAFGLGDAATVAASAVAAGIKPGADLERTLTLVGDAAQIAGVGMGDMGAIFNKAAASNKVQMDVINQLHDTGVPALALLADQMGVTAEEASKMASKGEIDFATFQKAMETGLGGAAQAAGGTFRGALANVKAALGRIGETVAVPVLNALRDAFNDAIPAIDKVNAALKPFVEELSKKISDALPVILERIKDSLEILLPALKDGAEFLIKWKGVIIPLVAAFGGFLLALDGMRALNNVVTTVKGAIGVFAAFNGVLLANPIILIVAAIAALVAALVYFFTQTETGKKVWDKVWNGIKDTWDKVWNGIKATWDTVSALITTGFTAFVDFLKPIFESIGNAWAVVWDGIQSVAQSVSDWFGTHVGPVFQAFGELIAAVWDVISARLELAWAGIQLVWGLMQAGFELLWGYISAVWETVGPPLMAAMEMAWNNAKTVIETVWNVVKTVFETVWNQIKTIFSTVWNVIKTVVETALGVIKGVIMTVTGLIKGDWTQVWNGIKQIGSSVWNGIKSIISTGVNAVKSTISNVLNAIKSTWNSIWNGIKEFASNTWDGIKSTFSSGVSTMRGIFTRMGDAIKSPFKSAFNAIARFWNSTVGKLSFEVPNWVPGMGGKGWSAPSIPMLATGGTALAAGWSLVGEAGPELLHMPRGASVVPLGHPMGAGAAPVASGGSSLSRSDADYLANKIVDGLSGIARGAGGALDLLSNSDRLARAL